MSELVLPPASAVIQAGAGAGKTHNLVSLCIQLLGRDPPLPPARLWAVTFTEKAAAELKGRIRARIDALAAEPRWRRIRRDLALAQIGTIHALCAQILRRHAPAAGIDPRFSLLEEQQSRRLLREACDGIALQALEGRLGAPLRDAARRLCAEMGLRTQGKFGVGLADEIADLLQKLGESGTAPLRLLPDPKKAALDDQRARRELERALGSLRATMAQNGKEAPASPGPALDAYAPGQLATVWKELRRCSPYRLRAQGAEKESILAARQAFDGVLDADAGVRGAALAADLAGLALHAAQRHRELKAQRGALDFDDLTRLCRDLLAQDAVARAAERERVGALLVDEFQDTSRAQIEIFEHLAGDRPVLVVGDRKQSIYEFRGADVAGAQEYAARLTTSGAARFVLGESRRSRPALVGFANLLFERALAAGGQPFDTPFSADDALTAFRPQGPGGPCAELLDVPAIGVEAEAAMVARRIAALLAPGAPERVFERDETPRPVRGGDVAVLLRKFTNLETFRRALLRLRIPHLVYKGRGFHSAREVMDLVALLAAAADPDDVLALASVLRAPFGPLSDDALVLLAQRRWSLEDPAGLAPDDAEALGRVRGVLRGLQREADRLGPAGLLEAALAETDYVAGCAAGLYGEQAAANVDKLLASARDAERRGLSLRAFLAGLRQLAGEEAREAEAAVVEERDPHAVRLLTVHAAKGLEFPVVIVPECAAPSFGGAADRVLLDAQLGLAVKAYGADKKRRWGAQGSAVSARRRARELAQMRRLFYVAVTRARDLLILSGRRARNEESWREWIDQISGDAEARGLLRIVRDCNAAPALPWSGPAVDPATFGAPSTSFPAPPSTGCPAPPSAGCPARADVARIAAAAPDSQVTLSAPVTQLADASVCPRRYQLLHELRLEERPDPEHPLPDPLGEEPGSPATALGTLAHRLLELAPLQLDAGARRRELARLLRLEGEDPSAHAEVLDAACAFLDSPLARRMAAAPSKRLHRELPFMLRLSRPGAPELLLRGQIDALLIDEDVTVVDYKLSQARDTARYAAQLDAYALAARELVGESPLPVRTGIVFLRSKGAPFVEHTPAATDEIRSGLLDAAQAIADGRRSGVWPVIEPPSCREIGCGFIRRCHGEAGGASPDDA
ncbi:MAG TPA: UvrD-helicase domain-containing protein [Myxococcales bacterium]|nr:UvrD-helicase domain-containing protein [Myxococcales bacterium]